MFKKTIVYLIGLALILNSGCITLRKKFIRKKKYQKEEPVYVDFKVYPSKPAQEIYPEYYAFLDAWLDELVKTLQVGDSLKRAKNCAAEAVMNMEEMSKFYNPKGKELIDNHYKELLAIKYDIENKGIGNEVIRKILLQKTERLQRIIRKDFNYNDAKPLMQ